MINRTRGTRLEYATARRATGTMIVLSHIVSDHFFAYQEYYQDDVYTGRWNLVHQGTGLGMGHYTYLWQTQQVALALEAIEDADWNFEDAETPRAFARELKDRIAEEATKY